MLESSDDLRFANHPVAQIFCNVRSVEDFDRDEPVEFPVFGEVHGAHAATREFFHERVLGGAEIRRGHDGPEIAQLVI